MGVLSAGPSSIARLTGFASKPSIVENPYGRIARQLWDGAGNQKFCEVINPERVQTILIEGDQHSLAGSKNPAIRRRYYNGIGTNVVVIPKSAGVTHDYFPGHPVARQYLRKAIEATVADSGNPTTPAPAPVGGSAASLARRFP